MKGYKRCKCRDDHGREIGAACPSLHRADGSWNPSHGTWYGKTELPSGPRGVRLCLRQGGFATQSEMSAWFEKAMQLLGIPDRGPDGHAARLEILALLRDTRRAKLPPPDYDNLRMRYQVGAAFRPGTTGEYLISWINARVAEKELAKTTLHSYRRAIERIFLPALGTVPLDKLTTAHITGIYARIDSEAAVSGHPVTMATKRRYHAVLRKALADAARPEAGLLMSNVAVTMRFSTTSDRSRRAQFWTEEREHAWRQDYETRLEAAGGAESFRVWRTSAAKPSPVMVWTPEQTGKFLDDAEGDRLYALFCLIAYRGLRRGEAVGLRWADTNLAAGSVMISQQLVQVGWKVEDGRPKTPTSEGRVKLDSVTLSALRAWRAVQSAERLEWGPAWTDTGLVFTREDGSAYHPAHVTARFERIAFLAGLPPVRLHDLRHGAASLALAGGANMKEVQEMLRHSSMQVTSDIYTSVLPEKAAEEAERTAAMVPRRAAVGGAPDPGGLPTVSRRRTQPRSWES